MRTELELALSLLDVAAVTERNKIVRGCVRNALSALRTASRFLASASISDDDNGDISRRQNELLKRLREVARQNLASRRNSVQPAA